jgi:hypothetical protein
VASALFPPVDRDRGGLASFTGNSRSDGSTPRAEEWHRRSWERGAPATYERGGGGRRGKQTHSAVYS